MKSNFVCLLIPQIEIDVLFSFPGDGVGGDCLFALCEDCPHFLISIASPRTLTIAFECEFLKISAQRIINMSNAIHKMSVHFNTLLKSNI